MTICGDAARTGEFRKGLEARVDGKDEDDANLCTIGDWLPVAYRKEPKARLTGFGCSVILGDDRRNLA